MAENFFSEHIEIENLIPFKVWVEVIEKVKTNNYKFKKDFKENETKFNNELKNKKIGVLLKEYVIEKAKNKKLDYFEKNNIEVLGKGKKEIMKEVVENIEKGQVSIDDFKSIDENKNILEKLEKFIKKNN